MAVSFEGFPRIIDAAALRPGRWFVAADGLRPVLGLATAVMDGDEPVALTFSADRVETVEFAAAKISSLGGPFGTMEDDIVFTPGLTAGGPTLTAPTRRAFRSGSLLRLRSGDMGLGFGGPGGELVVVSLASGERAESFDLVFERWTISLRRGAAETVLGSFKPANPLSAHRRG